MQRRMIYSRLEAEVERTIEASNAKILKRPSDAPRAFDFGIDFNGRRIAIEIKAEASPSIFFGMLGYQWVKAREALYDEFWLVTAAGPPADTASLMLTENQPIRWLSIDDLAAQLNAVSRPQRSLDLQEVPLLDVLSAQFGEESLHYVKSEEDLDALLRLGTRQEQVTCVFVDIKSFTEIVHNSEPSTLNEMLARYYETSRALAVKFGGTFDKVIGDAVLAVFNYPPIQKAASAALRYGIEVVRSGRAILEEFAQRSTAVVETGIRAGIATGEVWPIDVGQKVPQVSFVGDPLNLAARLQQRAAVNGIVTCRTTWRLAQDQNPIATVQLAATSIVIPKGELSGIATAINAQMISPEAIAKFKDV